MKQKAREVGLPSMINNPLCFLDFFFFLFGNQKDREIPAPNGFKFQASRTGRERAHLTSRESFPASPVPLHKEYPRHQLDGNSGVFKMLCSRCF